MSVPSPPARPKLSTLLPPIILGGGVFNTQMNTDPSTLPVRALIQHAFASGITAIDTSPYYGPSETLIGDALLHIAAPRSTYMLMTKAGRIEGTTFDYTPASIRRSVARSLARLHTTYLDVVFCHDVEFVSAPAVLTAVAALFALADEGVVKYVGISGYPPAVLASLAAAVKTTLGRPLDVVQSYGHYTLQNQTLLAALPALRAADVDVVINSSPLGMKLLSGSYPGAFHPAPRGLQDACVNAHRWCVERGETLPGVAMKWAFAGWIERGPTVTGASYVEELRENVDAYREMTGKERPVGLWSEARVNSEAVQKMAPLWQGVRKALGEWVDWSWDSPPVGYELWTSANGGSKL